LLLKERRSPVVSRNLNGMLASVQLDNEAALTA
jgi:hypothetical protein